MKDHIEYKVKVHRDGNKYWRINGQLHREDGPAIEYPEGSNRCGRWHLEGVEYTEDAHKAEMTLRHVTFSGKTVTIYGKTYRLTEVVNAQNIRGIQ